MAEDWIQCIKCEDFFEDNRKKPICKNCEK